MKDIWESLIWNPTFSQMSFISLSHQCHDSIQRHGETHYESVCVPTCISMEKTRCISMTVRWSDINDWHQMSWVSWPLRFTLHTSMTSEVHTKHINGSHYTHEYRVRFMSDVTSLMTSEIHINGIDMNLSYQWHWYESHTSFIFISTSFIYVGLFCRYVQLFCGCIGLFCRYVNATDTKDVWQSMRCACVTCVWRVCVMCVWVMAQKCVGMTARPYQSCMFPYR